MLKRTSLLLLAGLLLIPAVAFADTADVARGLVKTYANASVQLEGTMKAHAEGEGSANVRVPDKAIAVRGVVVDASGLTVCSLAKLNPLAGGKSISVRGMTLTLKAQIEDLTITLPNGTKVPARVVLTNDELGLAFIAPTTPLAADQKSSITAVELSDAKAKILDEIIILARASKSMDYAPMCTLTRITAVMTKPRLMYYASAMSGSMVFSADGKLLGIAISKKITRAIDASSGKANIGTTLVILPTSEIKALLPKAIEASKKPASAKPAPSKPSPKPAEPAEPSGPAPGEV